MSRFAAEQISDGRAWHVVTCEYPPQAGGVADYTRLVAHGLAGEGDDVCVWCPSLEGAPATTEEAGGRVRVRREMGKFSPGDLRRVGRLLDARPGARRLLVQYVPHGYGYNSANVAFCAWLWKRARVDGDTLEVVVHEPFLEFGGAGVRRNAAAAAHRLMAALLVGAARRAWVTTEAWGALLRPFALGRRVEFRQLPVPSTVPVVSDAAQTAEVRARCAATEGALVVGHLGTYPRHVAERLERVLPLLLGRRAGASALLMGEGSVEARARVVRLDPALRTRVHATGRLSAHALSAHLAACDLVVQPFADGVSCRRTSVMAALAHGLPVVTNAGRLTESLWAESGAVRLVAADDASALAAAAAGLLEDPDARARLAGAGRSVYRERFDVANLVAALRGEGEASPVAPSLVAERVKA